MNRNFKFHTKQNFFKKGMTLVELMVVLAIVTILISVTILNQADFKSNASLQNLTDDISLTIRRTQNFAIGVRSSQAGLFNTGYGIHFSTVAPTPNPLAGSNKAFMIFNDLNPNKKYDYSPSSTACNTGSLSSTNECIELLKITSSDIIEQICPNSSGCASGNFVDIVFLRPNPDAYICVNTGSQCTQSLSSVDIIVKNTLSNKTKKITVSNAGQISVQ